jgi:ABC-type lipoprotein release transport system permease subunit
MQSLLFHISATDPKTLVGVALVFAAIGCAASYFPAKRAAEIDAMGLLR